jgi:hypothetical protein
VPELKSPWQSIHPPLEPPLYCEYARAWRVQTAHATTALITAAMVVSE